jgi:hypothetical protein
MSQVTLNRCPLCDEWYDPNGERAAIHEHPEPQSGPVRESWFASRLPWNVYDDRVKNAAHELLEACKQARRELRCLVGQATARGETSGGPNKVIAILEAAISKADQP